ncbi:MAG: hypothetical protein ACT6U0_27135 [Shinella sp.]
MTFTSSQLIKIGRLFSRRDRQHDTVDIAKEMECTEQDIYNALSEARAAYRADLAWHRDWQQSYRDKARAAV